MTGTAAKDRARFGLAHSILLTKPFALTQLVTALPSFSNAS